MNELKRFYKNSKLIKEASKFSYVLLGESTHGTAEYFEKRLQITKILVTHYRFNTVFFETEWSLGYEINRFIHGKRDFPNLKTDWPPWMLNNTYIINLIRFLKKWNINHRRKVYFYGIDCQNIELAKKNMCQEENINCEIVQKIIENYPIMKNGHYWNIRDSFWFYIMKTVKKKNSKFILWAHNSHIGNNTKNDDQISIGSILQDAFPNYKIGFLTFNGTVTSSKTYNGKQKTMVVKNAIKSSYGYFFHTICINNDWEGLVYECDTTINDVKYLRYIGVVYNKQNEMAAHYQSVNIDKEFNVVIFIDKTSYLPIPA